MKRLGFTIFCALSLLLCVATCVLWVRSYRPTVRAGDADALDLTHAEPYYWIIANRGRFTFCRQMGKDWDQPKPVFRLLGIEFAGSWVGKSSLVNLFIPFWMLAGLTALPSLVSLRGWVKLRARRGRERAGCCANCGYDLRASPGRCPECGSAGSVCGTAAPAVFPPQAEK
ncbi:MAG: hypothetical protein JWL69_4553 [Phycisphaerales bacterium]|nr:hypothetical protein [Phycisphaerales bacterium]